MPERSIPENPTVSLRSNFLTVDDNTLRANVLRNSRSEKLTVSQRQLDRILLLGRHSILQGIEEFYEQQVERNPDAKIVRPSIFTAQLGTPAQTDGQASKVFTEQGYANGGVINSIQEIQQPFRGHWQSVRYVGFLPEVRRTSGSKDGGSWLLLRKPSLNDVLQHWLDQGWGVAHMNSLVERLQDKDKAKERYNLREYRMSREHIVDEASDHLRSREQISLILLMAAIKLGLGDKDGYYEEVDDALMYADNDPDIDERIVRAIENSTFELTTD